MPDIREVAAGIGAAKHKIRNTLSAPAPSSAEASHSSRHPEPLSSVTSAAVKFSGGPGAGTSLFTVRCYRLTASDEPSGPEALTAYPYLVIGSRPLSVCSYVSVEFALIFCTNSQSSALKRNRWYSMTFSCLLPASADFGQRISRTVPSPHGFPGQSMLHRVIPDSSLIFCL